MLYRWMGNTVPPGSVTDPMRRAAGPILISAMLLLAACSTVQPQMSLSPSPVLSPSPAPALSIAHPTGVTDIVLRMERLGGFLWPGATADLVPTFTLYGDGSVIYVTEEPGAEGRDVRRLRAAQMDEEQMAALLEVALLRGGLADARESYADVGVADAMTTKFTIDAGGVRKSGSVYALGEVEEPGPDSAARQAFLQLQTLLSSFESEVARGNAADAGDFDPEAYRVTVIEDTFAELEPTGPWPWTDLAPDDFERDRSDFGVGIVTAEQGQAAEALRAGEMDGPVVVGPDGKQYLIRIRPLLPDELP
jgi:hypothetical protein